MTQPRQTVGQSPYRAFITREPFLFYEMRTTARLLAEGMTEDEAIERITRENLFQYPTERSLRGMARACVRRLRTLDSAALVEAIVCQPQDVARQVCLYAMMRDNRVVWDFMLCLVARKFETFDSTLHRYEIVDFLEGLRTQSAKVATWSDATLNKVRQVLTACLANCGMYDCKTEQLVPLFLDFDLEMCIRANGDEAALRAFGMEG